MISALNHSRPIQAFSMALFIELLLLIGLVATLVNVAPPPRKISPPVALTIVTEVTPPTPVAKPKPLPPLPKPKLAPVHHERPHPVKPAPPAPTPPAPAKPLAPTPTPTAFTEPTPPPAPPPTPTPAPPRASTVNLHAEYQDKVRAAVQAAVYYPPAAVAMHFSGRVQVGFNLRDGVASATHIITSSNIGIIDRAALQAVQVAQYPAPPDDLRGKNQTYEIWIALTLTDSG